MHTSNYGFRAATPLRYRSTMVEKVARSPFGDRLAHAMSLPDNKLGPVELAEALGVTRQAIDKLLKGGSNEMSASNNARVARLLGVDPTWLAIGEGVARPSEFSIRWHERTLIARFRELPADEQDEFAAQLEMRLALHAKHAGAASGDPFQGARAGKGS
jgi:transcriptional regulator with XRE-family HTH domain